MDEELHARMVAMDEEFDASVEFSDDPEHVAWRRLRRAVEGQRDPDDDP